MLTVAHPPILTTINLEPTERRLLRLDFSRVLSGNIAALTAVDQAGTVAALISVGQVALVTLDALAAWTSSPVTINAATAAGQTERQTLRINVIDPASGIVEVDP